MRDAVTLFDGDEGDFVRSVLKSDDWSVISDAFAAVPEEQWEYIEPTTVARALLATEILVAHRGDSSGDLSCELFQWAVERNDPDRELFRRASRALRRTLQITGTADDRKDNATRDELRRRAKSLLTTLD